MCPSLFVHLQQNTWDLVWGVDFFFFFWCFRFVFVFWDRVLLFSPGWFWVHNVPQMGLKPVVILSPQSSKHWDYKDAPSHLPKNLVIHKEWKFIYHHYRSWKSKIKAQLPWSSGEGHIVQRRGALSLHGRSRRARDSVLCKDFCKVPPHLWGRSPHELVTS